MSSCAAHAVQEGEPRVNRVVFIGKDLDRKALTEGFRSCLAGAPEPAVAGGEQQPAAAK